MASGCSAVKAAELHHSSQRGLLDDVGGAAWLVDKAVFSRPLSVSAVLQRSIPHLLWKQVGDPRDVLGNTAEVRVGKEPRGYPGEHSRSEAVHFRPSQGAR